MWRSRITDGKRDREAGRVDDRVVGLDQFGMVVEHEADRPLPGHHAERLEARIEDERPAHGDQPLTLARESRLWRSQSRHHAR
jgi:hypothetical protein